MTSFPLMPGRLALLHPADLPATPGHGNGLDIIGARGSRAHVATSQVDTGGTVRVTAHVLDPHGFPYPAVPGGRGLSVVADFTGVTAAIQGGDGLWELTYGLHGDRITVQAPKTPNRGGAFLTRIRRALGRSGPDQPPADETIMPSQAAMPKVWTPETAAQFAQALEPKARTLLAEALLGMENERIVSHLLEHIRAVLADRIGQVAYLVFSSAEEPDGYFLSSTAKVFFTGGGTEDIDFDGDNTAHVAELLTSLHGAVGEDSGLAVIPKTGQTMFSNDLTYSLLPLLATDGRREDAVQ